LQQTCQKDDISIKHVNTVLFFFFYEINMKIKILKFYHHYQHFLINIIFLY